MANIIHQHAFEQHGWGRESSCQWCKRRGRITSLHCAGGAAGVTERCANGTSHKLLAVSRETLRNCRVLRTQVGTVIIVPDRSSNQYLNFFLGNTIQLATDAINLALNLKKPSCRIVLFVEPSPNTGLKIFT